MTTSEIRDVWQQWWIRRRGQHGTDKTLVLPKIAERRGAHKSEQAYTDASQVYTVVKVAVATHQQDAWNKKTNPAFWGNTGDVELKACLSALEALESVDKSLPLPDYLHHLNSAFLVAIEQYRKNDWLDPDGFGVGTLHAIADVLNINCSNSNQR